MKPLTAFLKDISAEFDFAPKKFPGNEDQLVALMEEVGELAQALLDLKQKKLKRNAAVLGALDISDESAHSIEIWKEAVQVASMAAKIAILGDKSFPTYDRVFAAMFSKSHYNQ